MQRARARKQKIYQKMNFQQQPESTWNPAKVTKPVTQNLPKPAKIEIFREHMIEQLYLDLTEETKIYGKLFQACQAAANEFSVYLVTL